MSAGSATTAQFQDNDIGNGIGDFDLLLVPRKLAFNMTQLMALGNRLSIGFSSLPTRRNDLAPLLQYTDPRRSRPSGANGRSHERTPRELAGHGFKKPPKGTWQPLRRASKASLGFDRAEHDLKSRCLLPSRRATAETSRADGL